MKVGIRRDGEEIRREKEKRKRKIKGKEIDERKGSGCSEEKKEKYEK